MKSLLALCFSSLTLLVNAIDSSIPEVEASLNNASVAQSASLTFEPSQLLQVAYPLSNGSYLNVTAGDTLSVEETALPPVYGFLNATRNITEKYVIAMVDLDAVNETVSEIRHFLGGNFELGIADDGGFGQLMNTTPAVTEYTQPDPPAGDDPHRYAFFIFAQSGKFNFQLEINDTTPITNFNLSQFVDDLDLGQPIGGTYILVGSDS